MTDTLLRLVEAHERAEKQLEAGGIVVWNALAAQEPELASEIVELFLTPEAAARWAVAFLKELGGSPARCVAEGRSSEVLSRIQRAAHGFVG